jgi:hypothetical protein
VFEFQTHERMGQDGVIHRRDTYRLPPGAVLLDKSPTEIATTTKGDQIELHLDKLLPPPGNLDVRLRYRLAPAAK